MQSSFIFKVCGWSRNKVWSTISLSQENNKAWFSLIWMLFKYSSCSSAASISEWKEAPISKANPNQRFFYHSCFGCKTCASVVQVNQINSWKAGSGGWFQPRAGLAKILRSFRSVQGKSDPAIAKKYQEICCKFSTKLDDNVYNVEYPLFCPVIFSGYPEKRLVFNVVFKIRRRRRGRMWLLRNMFVSTLPLPPLPSPQLPFPLFPLSHPSLPLPLSTVHIEHTPSTTKFISDPL